MRVVAAMMEMINEKLKQAEDLGKLNQLKKPSVRYCTVFSFIILLYCESYECIYISPICDVLTHY